MESISKIPVVILAGGRGARFDHESQVLPKPMIEVCGRPMLRHIIDSFVQQGFREFIIAGGYLVDEIHRYFTSVGKGPFAYAVDHSWYQYGLEYPDCGVKIVIADTGIDSHTGQRLGVLYERGFLSQPYVLTYGDGVSDVDMENVAVHHERYSDPKVREKKFANPYVTMTVVNPPGRFGVVEFFDGMPDGLVKVFGEKQKQTWDWINAGFMYVDPRFVPEYILTDEGGYRELEGAALHQLSRDGKMLAHRHHGYWRCMDTRRDLELIEKDVADNNGQFPWMKGREK